MLTVNTVTNRRPLCWVMWGLLGLAALYLLLLIPEAPPPRPNGAGKQAFRWSRDIFWADLENRFREARTWDQTQRTAHFAQALEQLRRAFEPVAETNLPPEAAAFDVLEQKFFEFASIAAVCPERLADCQNAAARLSQLVKWQSESWPSDSSAARQRLYRLLYGGRAAVEEVLLQAPGGTNPLTKPASTDVPATPGVEVNGLKLHSGDILLSRGGAATSALIARGNDYPGNFSHVALVHVAEVTKQVSLIEAHIQSGVAVSPIEKYLGDTKLRILVLRLRGNLPQLVANPLLPHQAATLALSNALARHIPYDFALDHADPGKQFCSEVAGAAYRSGGVTLWKNLSHLSAPGLTAWLAALGVRNFATQEPSDLEYDAQLRVVAEWRNLETLFHDHVDNAVIDAMLEAAERGRPLDFYHWELPGFRLAKAWSLFLNSWGGIGPVPEGMSATTALRVQKLKADHAAAKTRVLSAATEFKLEKGYVPPYWELLRLARAALAESNFQ